MKRQSLSLLGLLVGALSFGQTILSEGFESGIPSTWEIKSTNTSRTWETRSAGTFAYLKTGLAYVEADPNFADSDEWLITPSMDLSTATTPALEYTIVANPYFWLDQNTSDFYIKVSTDNGATWTQIWDDTKYTNFTNGFIPQRIRLNLDQYIGQANVKIAFQYKAIDTTGKQITMTALDNVSVTAKRDPYCVAYIPENKVAPITNVTFAGINNTSPNTTNGSDGYQNFTNIIGEVDKEQTYDIKVTANSAGPNTVNVSVFIDWNGNGTFGGPEVFRIGKTTNATTPLVKSVTIPAFAKPGLTRMRVITSTATNSPSCISGDGIAAGQIEDYSILIKGASTDPVEDGCTIFYPGSFESGTQIRKGVITANDFVVKANKKMDVKKLDLNVIGAINVLNFTFYKNNNGVPGDIIKTYENVAPTLQVYQTDSYGQKVYKNTFELPEILQLASNPTDTTYWLSATNPEDMTEVNYWSTSNVRTNALAKVSSNNGTTWQSPNEDIDGAFNIYGDCAILGTTDNVQAQKIAYFPNPVTDNLFIKSKKEITNISLHNFAGQLVKSNIKLNADKLNLTDLQNGIYVVKLNYQDGSSESFKIIKQ